MRATVERDALGREVALQARPTVSRATSPAARWPNRKFAPTTTAAACSRSTRIRSTNSSGDQRGHVGGERQRQDVVGAGLRQQLGALLDRGQRDGRVVRAQHRHRVRVEGDRDDLEAALVGDLAGPGDHAPVPEVHSVEVADHHDAAAQVGRDVVGVPPDLHGAKTIDASQTKTATARARPSRGSYNARNSPAGSNSAVRPARSRSSARPTRTSAACSVGEVDRGEPGPGGLGDRQQREVVGQRVQGAGDGQVVGPDGRPSQCRQVPADAERGAEVTGDRPDVRAARAAQRDVQVDRLGVPADVATPRARARSRCAARGRRPRRRGHGRRRASRRP